MVITRVSSAPSLVGITQSITPARSPSAGSLPLATDTGAAGLTLCNAEGPRVSFRRCSSHLGFATGAPVHRPSLHRSSSVCGVSAARQAMGGGSLVSDTKKGGGLALINRRSVASSGVLLLAAIAQFGGRGTPPSTSTNLQASMGATADEVFSGPAELPSIATRQFPASHALLGSATAILLAVVGVFAATEGIMPVLATAETWQNVPAAAALFGVSDVVAQKMEKQEKIDMSRMITASAIGILVNAFGFAFWVRYLDMIFSDDMVGFSDPASAAGLASKTLFDSFVYGTISNSAGAYLRRLFRGETVGEAAKQWEESLPKVMVDEFRFWPFFQALTYGVVPPEHRVQFTAIGAFIWNVYMSMSASDAPATEGQATGGLGSEGEDAGLRE